MAPFLVALGLVASPARAEIAPEDGALPVHGSSRAELEAARGQPVARVTVAGNRRIPSETLAEYVSLRAGQTFTPEALARDVRALWDSGSVEDVEVDLSSTASGVALRFLVREWPTVKSVEFSGNHALDTDDLREAAAEIVKAGDVLSYDTVRRARDKIRDKYAEEGYYLAEVADEVTPAKGGQSLVRFRITEHQKVSVRSVTFVGNRGVSTEELSEVMLTGKGGLLASLGIGTGGPFRQDMFERDIAVLNALYYDKGYLAVRIDTPRVMLSPDHEGIEVTVPIEEGPRFRIRRLEISERDADGREIEPLGGRRHLREMLRAKPGDFFNRAELVKDIGAIQTMYRDAGYANVEVPPQTELDPDKEQVDVVITLRRRRPVRIGRVEIRGNTKTRDKVIRRELEIGEEALFSETGLERSRRRVQALGFFERVDLSTSEGALPDHLDVTVEVQEKPTGTFQVGAGFSSMESFLFTTQIQQQNLFGSGRSLTLDAQLSGLRQLVDFRFYEPHLADTPFSLSVNLFDQIRTYDQFTQATKGGSLTLGHPLGAPSLYGSLTYTLQHDRVETGSGSALFGTSGAMASAFPRLPLANLFADGVTSSVRPMITYDTRNNQLFPTSGAFVQASLEAGSSWLGSQNEFFRWQANARFYYPLDRDESIVLRFNGQAGLVTSPSPHGVPLFQRYFLGGILDVRGFPLRSLGPRIPMRAGLDPHSAPIPDGANVGGNLMYYQNLELEFPILKPINLRGVLFTDLGNAWNTEGQYCRAAPASRATVTNPCFSLDSLLAVRTSWGFGVRWLSPMGPLRFEWGFPFKPLPYEKAMDFQFTIGSAF